MLRSCFTNQSKEGEIQAFSVHIKNLDHRWFVMICCRLDIPITGDDILMNSRLFLGNLAVYLFVNSF